MKVQTQGGHPLDGSTVLVTGGTGFTGTNLVRKLVDIGCEVRGIARVSSRIEDDLGGTVSWFRGDVYDPDVISQAMAGVNYVFHMATCYRDGGATDREHWKVHVQSTQMLAKAAAQEPNFMRFVHTSTVGVHGHIENPPADETTPFNPGDIYQETKFEGENWIRDFAGQSGLPLVVIRPAAIMGPADRRLLKLFRFARIGFFPLLDGHNTRYHLIHVEDLTDCMILSAYHPSALGEVFICGNDKSTTVVEMLDLIGDVLEKRIRYIRVPGRPLFLLADFVEWISERLRVEPVLYRRRLAFFTKDRAFNTSKIQDTLEFDYQFDNESAVRDTAIGYVERGWL